MIHCILLEPQYACIQLLNVPGSTLNASILQLQQELKAAEGRLNQSTMEASAAEVLFQAYIIGIAETLASYTLAQDDE